jgi:hypothetical protein
MTAQETARLSLPKMRVPLFSRYPSISGLAVLCEPRFDLRLSTAIHRSYKSMVTGNILCIRYLTSRERQSIMARIS